MKKILIIFGAVMIMFLVSCNKQMYKSLETENKKLIQRIDSLNIMLKIQSDLALANAKQASTQKRIADSAVVLAKLQKQIADNSTADAMRLAVIAKKNAEVAMMQRAITDSAVAVAKFQKQLADSSTAEAMRLALIAKANAKEALRQRVRADSIANQLKVKK
jgi:hypothetical protein